MNNIADKYDYDNVIIVKKYLGEVPKVNYKYDGGIDERKDLITDTAKFGFTDEDLGIEPEENYYEKFNKDLNIDMTGIKKLEKKERIEEINGKKLKIITLIKHMDNGEIKNEEYSENIN
jgi:hypothetical protein